MQKHSRGCRWTDVSVRMGHTVTGAGGQLQEEASVPGTAERWPPGHHGVCAGPPPANSRCKHSGGEGAPGCCHCSCDARISLAAVTPCAALVLWPISFTGPSDRQEALLLLGRLLSAKFLVFGLFP